MLPLCKCPLAHIWEEYLEITDKCGLYRLHNGRSIGLVIDILIRYMQSWSINTYFDPFIVTQCLFS